MNPLWSSPQLRLDVRACGFYSLEQNPRVIRMALGALPKQILVLVLQSGARLALFGVAVGIASGILVTRLMTRLLYQVSASNPFVFGGAAALFTFALLACYVPARRAARDDPFTYGHCK